MSRTEPSAQATTDISGSMQDKELTKARDPDDMGGSEFRMQWKHRMWGTHSHRREEED